MARPVPPTGPTRTLRQLSRKLLMRLAGMDKSAESRSLVAHNSLFDGFAAKIFISRAVLLGFPAQPLFPCQKQSRYQTQSFDSFSWSRSSHLVENARAGAGTCASFPLDLGLFSGHFERDTFTRFPKRSNEW